MSLAIYIFCAALAAALCAIGWQIYSARGVKSANRYRGPNLFILNPKIVTKHTDRAAFPPGQNQNQKP